MSVSLNQEEQNEYDKLEAAAKLVYLAWAKKSNVGRQYLMLFQKLSPLRIACAGGPVPEEDETATSKEPAENTTMPDAIDGTASSDATDEGKTVETNAKPKARPKRFSKFAFTSKFKVLIAELAKAREADATGKRSCSM